jgi:hypothetical protein
LIRQRLLFYEAEARGIAASEAGLQVLRSSGNYEDTRRMIDVAQEAVDLARKDRDAARAIRDTAEKQHSEINAKLNFYYSGAFYFAFFQSPIRTAETDAEGKFVIEVPQTGRFVIVAQAERSIMDYAERYYWLQPVSLEGQQQHTQNLSNNNLTRTTGTSALILTQD